ncbi:hypothetical protein H5410_006248 [Solanum commersonii]|uniref:Uncharacterized protein n=1 Tax=Solanum commersonii TaxID=4109 RepID=A0A9J6A8N1_SOLCO|nr:hypothetical protein H5410_006248 [Solanum commersonii]
MKNTLYSSSHLKFLDYLGMLPQKLAMELHPVMFSSLIAVFDMLIVNFCSYQNTVSIYEISDRTFAGNVFNEPPFPIGFVGNSVHLMFGLLLLGIHV